MISFFASNYLLSKMSNTELSTLQHKQRLWWAQQKARKLLKKAHANQYKHMYHNLIGSNANELGINKTAQIFQIDRTVAKYLHTKQKNRKFHSESHGGVW